MQFLTFVICLCLTVVSLAADKSFIDHEENAWQMPVVNVGGNVGGNVYEHSFWGGYTELETAFASNPVAKDYAGKSKRSYQWGGGIMGASFLLYMGYVFSQDILTSEEQFYSTVGLLVGVTVGGYKIKYGEIYLYKAINHFNGNLQAENEPVGRGSSSSIQYANSGRFGLKFSF